VYSVIADYHHGHPRILPKQFTGLSVEKGGVGEGTVIRFSMRVFGRRFEFRGFVSEPEPGRVLVERNVGENESVTSFPTRRCETVSGELRLPDVPCEERRRR
jgi:hypothetical protein